MQEKYQMSQHKIYKAIIRPVLYFGVPLELLFCISAFLFIIGLFCGPIIWFLIPVVILSLGLLTRKDAFFFHILYLKWQTTWLMKWSFDRRKKDAVLINQLLGCQVVTGGRYTTESRVGVCKVIRSIR